MTHRFYMIGLLALLLLVAGCAEELKAPTDPVAGNEGTLVPVVDAFATAMAGGVESYYYVYLPDGYSDSGTPFPVVYMLHGYGGDENYFPNIFSLKALVDEQIAMGDMDPMVLVFPNGSNALGGAFYTDGTHPIVATSEAHILQIVGFVESDYNVATDAAGKGIAGHSMGGYGSLNIALNNPGMFGFVGSASAPVSFWGTKTIDPADDTYSGIEELLPTILAQTGYDPATDTPADYQTKMNPSVGPPTSMMFAMAAAFSPGDPANPGPTYVPFNPALPGVELPIGLDGEIYMPVWQEWLKHDIMYRTIVPDGTNQAASFATFDLYLTVGLQDDLGLYGAHQVLEGTLTALGMTPEVSRYYSEANGVPAGHVELTASEFLMMLEWFDGKF
jgi:pimeloyl-ACP methyl ester carboxylesterase